LWEVVLTVHGNFRVLDDPTGGRGLILPKPAMVGGEEVIEKRKTNRFKRSFLVEKGIIKDGGQDLLGNCHD